MDHSQCRARISHLEDELDYNFGRKEELKKDVKRLEEKYESLHKTHFDNVKVLMDNNRENYDLKEKIKLIEKENSELNKENFKNVKTLEEAEMEIDKLKSTSVSKNKESEKTIRDLRADNHNLKNEIKNILKM